MKNLLASKSARGFSLVDLVTVIAVVAILAALSFSMVANAQTKAKRITCVDHLKNFGLEARTRPMDARVAMENLTTGSYRTENMGETNIPQTAWQYVLATKTMSTASRMDIWTCPADNRKPAPNWSALRDTNMSYFISVLTNDINPSSILYGDRNLSYNKVPVPPGRRDLTGLPIEFTAEMHHYIGNVALGDGSIQGVSRERMKEAPLGVVYVP